MPHTYLTYDNIVSSHNGKKIQIPKKQIRSILSNDAREVFNNELGSTRSEDTLRHFISCN